MPLKHEQRPLKCIDLKLEKGKISPKGPIINRD